MNKQRRFALLMQTGIAKLSTSPTSWVKAFDLALQVPEESIPDDVAKAALETMEWLLYLDFAACSDLLCKPDAVCMPPWIEEWLERENRPNPFA